MSDSIANSTSTTPADTVAPHGLAAGEEFLVNTTTRNDQHEPSVTGLSGGGFVVTWTDVSYSADDNSSTAVRGQQFSANGGKVGSEFLVYTTTHGAQYQPSVTGLSGGGFVVTWTDGSGSADDNSNSAVRAQQFSANGTKLGSEFLVNTTTRIGQFGPSVTGLSGGGFVVTWSDSSLSADDNSYSAVRGQQFSANGAKLGSEFLVNTTTRNGQFGPSVTGLSGGGFVVTWTDDSYSADDNSYAAVRGQQFSANGAKLGSEFLVNTTTRYGQAEPSVTGLSGGGFVVTWTDGSYSADDNSGYAVRGRVFGLDAALVPLADNIPADASTSSALTLNTSNGSTIDGVGDQDWFRISLTAGTAYTFHQDQASGSSLDPYLRVFNSSGTVVAENSGSSSATLTFTPTFTSTYYVSAGGSGASTGAYTLSGTADAILASTATAAHLTLSTSNGSTIDGAGDQDWFSISLNAGTTYIFRQSAVGESTLDPFLRLMDALGTEIISNDNSAGTSNSLLTYTPTRTGTYYVSAGAAGTSTGAYSLTADMVSFNKLTADIFRSVGRKGAEEGVDTGIFNAGKMRVMADFSKAAYQLQSWEKETNGGQSINVATNHADEAFDAIFAQGWVPLDLNTSILPSFTFDDNLQLFNRMAGGYYTNGNGAALVARSADSLVISFRGTNDIGAVSSPDAFDWFFMEEHYKLFQPLVEAVDAYVTQNTDSIKNVYVTGHSLGGAMAIRFMQDHLGPMYSAVTFAAPGFIESAGLAVEDIVLAANVNLWVGLWTAFNALALSATSDRDRITHIEINGDVVPDFVAHGGRTIHFEGNETMNVGADNHSMDYYHQITKSVDPLSWMRIINEPGDPEVLLGARYDNSGSFIVDGTFASSDVISTTFVNNVLDDILRKDYDVFYGGLGNDELRGGSDGEMMLGGSGNDIIHGNGGSDRIYGDSGDDHLYGGPGDDHLYGGSGDFDVLWGQDGDDEIFGESGTDILIGGNGSDTLTGGLGVDGFGFITPYEQEDTITDFQIGEDKIVILKTGFGIENFDVVNLFSIRNRPNENPTFILELETGILYYDSNRGIFDEPQKLALMVGVSHLGKEDFLLV